MIFDELFNISLIHIYILIISNFVKILNLMKMNIFRTYLLYNFALDTLQPFNPFISDNDKHPLNKPRKLLTFETFQFFKGFISDNNVHPLNMPSKLLAFETFQFCKGLYLIMMYIYKT